MKLDEMARDAADALHVSVAHLEPPPIAEKPRLGRVGVAALARVAVLFLVVAVGVGWWVTRDSTNTVEIAVGSGEVAEIPRLGLISPQWRAAVAVELPLPAQLAERLPEGLVGIDEGVVVLYEDSAGSGAFVTLTTQRGDIDEHRVAIEQAGDATSDTEVLGARGFKAAFHTEADAADVRAVAWAPTDRIVATLTLTGFETADVDLVALAESATLLDDQTWFALQEVTGWAAAIRSATGDYDTTPIDIDALELSDLLPTAELVAALAGIEVEVIDLTADSSPAGEWRTLAGGETLPLTVDGRTYTWSSGSLRVLLAIALDDSAADAADDLIGGLGDDEARGPGTDLDAASIYRSSGRFLVHVDITGWPDDLAEESAQAVAVAIIKSAERAGG